MATPLAESGSSGADTVDEIGVPLVSCSVFFTLEVGWGLLAVGVLSGSCAGVSGVILSISCRLSTSGSPANSGWHKGGIPDLVRHPLADTVVDTGVTWPSTWQKAMQKLQRYKDKVTKQASRVDVLGGYHKGS